MIIKITELKKILQTTLASKYYSQDEAEKIAEVLLYAELTGKNTQGIVKLLGTEPAQNIKPKSPTKMIKKTKVSFVIDGGGAAGPLPAQLATDKLITIAKQTGFSIAGTKNTYSSVGAISYYARKIAKNDLIGIVSAGSPKSMLHYGGIESVYGTKPIAFGFPTNEHPIVFDMASSAITYSGLIRAKVLREKLPENVAVDKNGTMTTDPAAALLGAILPFDRSYKGSGLAMVVELLSGPLTGASFTFDKGDWGTFFMAFSPDLLTDTHTFKRNASELVKKVKSGKTIKGAQIHIPGYDTEKRVEEILTKGEVEIEDTLLEQLKSALK